MALEDTIKYTLFRMVPSDYVMHSVFGDVLIECKAEFGRPVPLCISNCKLEPNSTSRISLGYRMLYMSYELQYTRSTPRALYKLLFGTGLNRTPLVKVHIKDSIYYYAPGVLFNASKQPLFYFALDINGEDHTPRLYVTPVLLRDAFLPNKPMEKFFMSTIVPFLVNEPIYTDTGFLGYTLIEIDNHVDDVFFVPDNRLIRTTPVDQVNAKLNDILAANADTISNFVENY